MRTLTAILLFVAVAAVADDSPLVALAKRTNRKASKTPVITNETVAASAGRLSMPAGEGTATTAATSDQATAAAAATTAEPVWQKPADVPPVKPAAATVTGPALVQPDPSGTARNIEPQVTGRTIDPTMSAQTINPQTTANTVEPQSTARVIEPQSASGNPPR